MLIKYIKIILVNILLFLNFSVKADTHNYIVGNNKEKINQRIDNFFIKNSNEKKVLWVPDINGKSRYAFSINKGAYLSSKKYADPSDLYYLSEKIDEGLNFELNNSKQIEISLLKNNFEIAYRHRHLMDMSSGIFFENKDKSFGIVFNKDFITSKNSMANIGIIQAKDKYVVFEAKFVKLFNNEDSELYGSLNHEVKSDILNLGIAHTWFEIANQYDLTIDIQEQDKKMKAALYASFGDERMKFEIGLDQIKNVSQSNIFF